MKVYSNSDNRDNNNIRIFGIVSYSIWRTQRQICIVTQTRVGRDVALGRELGSTGIASRRAKRGRQGGRGGTGRWRA